MKNISEARISFITNDIQNIEIISDTAEMEKIVAKPDDIISFDASEKEHRGDFLKQSPNISSDCYYHEAS